MSILRKTALISAGERSFVIMPDLKGGKGWRQ